MTTHQPSRLFEDERTGAFTVQVDGQPIQAYEGETAATVLLAAGRRAFFENEPPYFPSRLYCGMGTCLQCLVTIDHAEHVRACQTYVRPGMEIETHR
jgi:predicted molibdopterin-dependent oxidoreductase YjgC